VLLINGKNAIVFGVKKYQFSFFFLFWVVQNQCFKSILFGFRFLNGSVLLYDWNTSQIISRYKGNVDEIQSLCVCLTKQGK
jgi:hypothetical protein